MVVTGVVDIEIIFCIKGKKMNNEDFFRHCWLTLKRSKPRLQRCMNKIEYTIGEAGTIVDENPVPDKRKERDNDEPEPKVRHRV